MGKNFDVKAGHWGNKTVIQTEYELCPGHDIR